MSVLILKQISYQNSNYCKLNSSALNTKTLQMKQVLWTLKRGNNNTIVNSMTMVLAHCPVSPATIYMKGMQWMTHLILVMCNKAKHLDLYSLTTFTVTTNLLVRIKASTKGGIYVVDTCCSDRSSLITTFFECGLAVDCQ